MKKVLIFICFFFLAISNSFAMDLTGDYQGGSLTDLVEIKGTTTNWPYPYLAGVRISFVSPNGTVIMSKDYITDADYNNIQGSDAEVIYSSIGSCGNKVTYAKGGCSLGWNNSAKISSLIGNDIRRISSFTVPFSMSNRSFNMNFDSAIGGWNYSNVFDPILPESNKGNNNYGEQIKKAFQDIPGGNEIFIYKDNSMDPKYLLDVYMIVEPVTMVTFNGKLYYGTEYELSVLGKSQKGGGFTDACDGSTALCDVRKVLRKKLPCSSYLDGSLSYKLPDDYKNKGLFTSSNYFGGSISIKSNAGSICSSGGSYFTDSDVANSNSGIGIAIVWLGDMISQGLTCDVVNKGMTSNYQSIIASYYNSKNLNGFYSAYPKLSYKDESGNTQSADSKWYVNECTCYGMYDVFDKNYIPFSKNYWASSIENVNKWAGNNWYEALKMTNVKSSALPQIFGSKPFTDYNEAMKNYSSKITPMPATWTTADAAKYINLKCGTQEVHWCCEVEDWYKVFVSKNNLPYPKDLSVLSASQVLQNKAQINNVLYAYNIANNFANRFYWSVDEKNNSPTFSFVESCKKGSVDLCKNPGGGGGPSCSAIDSFYGKKLSDKSCTYVDSFSFTDYNKATGQNITSGWYSANCGCNNKPLTNCTPKYNVGTCATGDKTYYKDSMNGVVNDQYWDDCVFNDNGEYDLDNHKTSSKGSNSYFDDSISNQYCEVYCIEEMSANFDTNRTVLAGNKFTWNNHSVSGSRTCKTKKIDWDTFNSDLKEANQDIIDTYLDWKLEEKKSNSISKYSTQKSSSSCSCINNTSHNTCCRSEKTVYNSRTCTRRVSDGVSCKTVFGIPICVPKYKTERYDCSYYSYPCTAPDNTRYDLHTASQVSFADGTSGQKVTWGPQSWCSNESAPKTFIESKHKAYLNAVSTGNTIVNAMQSCYKQTAWQSNLYNLDPKVNVSYSDKTYSYNGELDRTKTQDQTSSKLDCDKTTKVEQIKGCSGTNCPKTKVEVWQCKSVEMTNYKGYSFYIPSDVYRYVIKDTNQSVMTNDFQRMLNDYKSQNKTLNYTDVGQGNFPVAYKTVDGYYGHNSSNGGELSLEYSNLGHTKNNRTVVDDILASVNRTDYNHWYCEFNVSSKLINNKDITVVFRPIDLTDPFPDKNGTGRNTGSNWCGDGNCNNKNYIVNQYITNNRGVKEEDVYTKEPMYTFVLTPAIINQIRDYNKENSYDSYYGASASKYYDFVCDKNSARRCISDYLTNLIEVTGATGTCTTDRKGKFDSCRN